MRVLWTSMYEFPALSNYLGHSINFFGGWVNSSAKALLDKYPDLELGVVIPSNIHSLESYTIYLYRYEEHEMLAEIIMRLFVEKDCLLLHSKERESALKRHHVESNSKRLYNIY